MQFLITTLLYFLLYSLLKVSVLNDIWNLVDGMRILIHYASVVYCLAEKLLFLGMNNNIQTVVEILNQNYHEIYNAMEGLDGDIDQVFRGLAQQIIQALQPDTED